MKRRGFLAGLAGLVVAPRVVRAESIMPVRSWSPVADYLEGILEAGGTVPPGRYSAERGLVLRRGDGLMRHVVLEVEVRATDRAGVDIRAGVNGMRFIESVISVRSPFAACMRIEPRIDATPASAPMLFAQPLDLVRSFTFHDLPYQGSALPLSYGSGRRGNAGTT